MITLGRPAQRTEDLNARPTTSQIHRQAVERVIFEARKQLEQPLSLSELAEIAWLSPYHFNRVFHQITGVSPFHFLAALRMEAAKRMLLTTSFSVTDICFTVGYQSLGSFTTHFGRFVGMPPTRLRALPLERVRDTVEALRDWPATALPCPSQGMGGHVAAQDGFSGPTFIGLFPTPIPQQRPAACCLLNSPGAYHIPHIPDGTYYAVAAAFEWSGDPLDYLLPDPGRIRIGVGEAPVVVAGGRSLRAVDIELRVPRLIDPPILIALPLLLAEHRAHGRACP